MAGVAEVQGFERVDDEGSAVADVLLDPGNGNTATAQHMAPPGVDAVPLNGDYAATVIAPGQGRQTAVAYLDARTAGKASAGEHRVYARDPATGDVVGETWHKADGSIVSTNYKGRVTLSPDGTLTIDSDVAIVLSATDVRLGTLAGQAVARVGDLVAVTVPPLSAAGLPVSIVPSSPPALPIAASGQIISGSTEVKA